METCKTSDTMISVILTVFNSEKYLDNCLNSLIKQTYDDFEVICIDNNSTDSSSQILEYFSLKDSRIKIYKNKINKCEGYCRNKGLELANHEYVFFLDDHSWLDSNTFEMLLKKAVDKKLDMIIFDNFENNIYNHDTNILQRYNSKVFNHLDLEKEELFNMSINTSNILYSNKFLTKNEIRFHENDRVYYEIPFFFKTFLLSKKISYINENFSNNTYLFNKSLIEKINNNVNLNLNSIYLIFEAFLDNRETYEYYKKFLLKYIFENILDNKYDLIENENKEKLFILIQKVYQKFINDYKVPEDILNYINKEILKKYEVFGLIKKIICKKPKVSVIIPIYNVKPYLKTCLESSIHQTLSDIEIICVNDGSNDGSETILKEYENLKNFKIINQENCGTGSARNLGLEYATGEYIFFLDSDDCILWGTLEALYKNAISNDSDLVISKISRFDEYSYNFSIPGFPFDEIFREVDFNNFTFNYKKIKNYVLNASFSACTKLYKKEFLDKYDDFNFSTGIAYEDVLFHIKCLLRSKRMSFVPNYFYQYRRSNYDSITHTKSNTKDILTVCNDVKEFLINNDYYNEFEFEFTMFKIKQLSQYIPIADSEEYFELVKKEFLDMDVEKYLDTLPSDLSKSYKEVINQENI